MESLELKLRTVGGEFPAAYTKKIVAMFGEPELSIEVQTGQPSEEILRLLDSLGYHVGTKKPMDGWLLLKAAKERMK